MTFDSNNLHYAFYVEYYKDIAEKIQGITSPKKANELSFQEKNKDFIENITCVFDEAKPQNNIVPLDSITSSLTTLDFKIIYPGLLIGTGITHGCGAKKEIALGFTFDYVTGIPYLPGSSVKGILRDAFQHRKYIQEVLQEILQEELKNKKEFTFSEEEIKQLELIIFEGIINKETIPVSQRIIFYDAILDINIHKEKKEKTILGLDTITPHRKNKELLELAEPEPVTFLKILPGNVLHFVFKLEEIILSSNQALSKENVKTLFQIILEDMGVGGKTNVGYGTLEHYKREIEQS